MNTLPNKRPRLFPPRPNHVDIEIRYGHYFPVEPLETVHLGGGHRQRQLELMADDEARFWSDEGREL